MADLRKHIIENKEYTYTEGGLSLKDFYSMIEVLKSKDNKVKEYIQYEEDLKEYNNRHLDNEAYQQHRSTFIGSNEETINSIPIPQEEQNNKPNNILIRIANYIKNLFEQHPN